MMNKSGAFALALAALLLQGCATPVTEQSLKAELARRGDAWDQAIIRKDRAAIAANMRDDFQHIREGGAVSGKEEFISFMMAPELVIDPYKVEDFSVRVYGDVALVGGTTRMTGRYAGTPFKSHYRYIDVYVRSGGEWKVSSVQITPMRD